MISGPLKRPGEASVTLRSACVSRGLGAEPKYQTVTLTGYSLYRYNVEFVPELTYFE